MISAKAITGANRIAHGKIIRDAVTKACGNALGTRLRAIVLTGSVARGEESLETGPLGDILLSDVECVIVLAQETQRPSPLETAALCRSVERRLASRRLRAHVSLAVVHEDYLRRLPAHIFSYELRECGEVILGDPGVLDLIPPFAARDLAHEDAWRMLSNRIVEQLAFASELKTAERGMSDSLHYATVKLCLDLATSLLVFLGEYEPCYRAREERFRRIARSPLAAALPFPALEFAERLRQCTAWKLSRQGHPRESSSRLWFEISEYARQAWLWELRQLLGSEINRAPAAMVRQLAHSQGALARLRGWLHVMRCRGWWRSARSWPKWLRLAVHYSPRYAIYLAAFQFLEGLPKYFAGEPPLGLDQMVELLPCRITELQRLSVDDAAVEITANYNQFVTGTRA